MIDGGETKSHKAEPRAPSKDAWSLMTHAERERAVLALPAVDKIEVEIPEGDAHRRAKVGAAMALESFFKRTRRRIYVSSDLAVYYPDEPRIVPDLVVTLDVELRDRTKWVVSEEGKGVDLIVEVHLPGRRPALGDSHERRVERYAALGISEYFVVDRERKRLRGYRLANADARAYEPIAPEEGKLHSRVLGLDLMIYGPKIRFFYGTAMLPEVDELASRLAASLNEAMVLKEDAERHADDETRRADRESARAEDVIRRAQEIQAQADHEARRAEGLAERAALAERRLAEALSELHKLKGWE